MGQNNNDIYLSEDPVLFFDQTHNPSPPQGGPLWATTPPPQGGPLWAGTRRGGPSPKGPFRVVGGDPEGLTQGSKLQQKLYTEQHISARKMDDLLMFGIQRASRSATQRV